MKFLFILDKISVLRAIIPFYLHLHSHVIMSWKTICSASLSDDNRFSFCLANDLSLFFFLRHGTPKESKDFYCLANTRHQIFCIHYPCLSPLFDNISWTRRVWDRVLLHKKWTAKIVDFFSQNRLFKASTWHFLATRTRPLVWLLVLNRSFTRVLAG